MSREASITHQSDAIARMVHGTAILAAMNAVQVAEERYRNTCDQANELRDGRIQTAGVVFIREVQQITAALEAQAAQMNDEDEYDEDEDE